MKLIPVNYFGFTAMDRRFSSPMLPWIISEIRKRDTFEKLSLGVEDGHLQAYDADFEVQFSHRIHMMTRFSQADLDPSTFLYLLREEEEHLLYCYLFQAASPVDVSDLYQQMKDQIPTRSVSSAAKLTSLCVDISPSSSHFFEVLYIGKIKVSHKKVPDTFIDDALEKFKVHNSEKSRIKNIGAIGKLKSENDISSSRRGSQDSVISESGSFDGRLQRQISDPELKQPDLDEHNRTMVLQVGRSDLRLISPDRKLVLLHKQHTDIATCIQGIEDSDHFGFICKEGNNLNTFIGYVFKCESASVASDAVNAISQAFINAETRALRREVTSCDHCPMVWYHKLCVEIEHMSDRKTQAAIFRKIDLLDEEEQNTILTKFRGAETETIREQNEFLMMLLRAHCEMKQGRHTHDTAENRSEFLNQYLGGSTIFMKAKRSLSNSFDTLLKRKASKDDLGAGFTLPISGSHNRENSPNIEISDAEGGGGHRSRTSTIGSSQGDLLNIKDAAAGGGSKQISPERGFAAAEKTPKSPMMDIFLKVGNSPKSPSSADDGSPHSADRGSWRQAIFNRVTTPNKTNISRAKRNRDELRQLWKKSIHQAILLVRMEKENARLRARQEESAVKRIKLEYDEMLTGHRELIELWDLIINREAARGKCDAQRLFHACRQGIPRAKRGEAWWLLADQHCLKTPPIDTSMLPLYGMPYDQLLKQLTSHQHAILIDLGRTFPAHAYYSSPLGPGQLALFNLLKAYSLMDPEVGYCQGLSFVAGVLLLHVDEPKAFILLRHLMFRRGQRALYMPDMAALQLRLYQLARLLHDQLPDLYQHLDLYEVAPTLYAAPWILTIFASQFPLGFVTRVFDMVFLEGANVILHICVILLTLHKDNLMACDSFEEIMDYLKVKLPAIDQPTLEAVMKQVFVKDISKNLDEYEVEYHVLQDEVERVQPQVEALQKLEQHNKTLTDQNKTILAQLETALANVQRLERMRTLQQNSVNRLEVQVRGLQVTVNTLGLFITDLVDRRVNVEIPGDVRRIIANIAPPQPPPMVKSLSMGRLSLNHQHDLAEPLRALAEDNVGHRNPNKPFKTALSNPNLGTKMSNFFSNSHNHILQQKLNKSSSKNETNLKTFIEAADESDRCDELDSPVGSPKNVQVDISIDTAVDAGKLVAEKPSPTDSIDSGVGTPATEPHPLSNCDVNFTYNGTSQLKNIKSFRTLSTSSSDSH